MKRRLFLSICAAVAIGLSASSFFVFAGETIEKKAYPLTLQEATDAALLNNFDIQLTKYDAWIARTDKKVAQSIYDTVLEASVKYRDDQSKSASTFAGTKTTDHDYNIGLSRKLPTGTTVSLDMENNRNWTDSAFSTSPLTHDSALGVTIEQDLGRNFFGLQDRAGIKITLVDIENAEYTTLDKIETSLAEVQKAYWDLVLETELVKIEESMVSEAQKLYDLYQEKLKDGLAEAPEAIASEANYRSRENALLLARNRVKAKTNVLKLLLNLQDDVDIEPVESSALPEGGEELVASLRKAFDHRQDYKKAKNEILSKDIALSMKKNSLWPQINLTATLRHNGLGDHFKQAVTQITDENNPDFFAGLQVKFPLENRAARGKLEAAELEKARALLKLKQLERKIAIDVADQVRNCNIFREVADNSREIAELQARKLEEEIKRFRYGRSNTDMVIRFQEDLVQARGVVAAAVQRYHAALVDLRKKEGTLLGAYLEGGI